MVPIKQEHLDPVGEELKHFRIWMGKLFETKTYNYNPNDFVLLNLVLVQFTTNVSTSGFQKWYLCLLQ